MSEDQIRTELAELRAIQRESHYELVELMGKIKDEILSDVKDYNETLKEEVDERNKLQLSNFRWLIGILIVPMLGFFSWLAIDHLDLKEKHKELKTDFGTVLRTTQFLHQDAVGYNEIVDKYFPSRGATLNK